jgi:hypothetical protein
MENLLEKDLKNYDFGSGATLVGAIVGIIVGVILVVAVAIPISNDVITSANLSGTTKTIVQIIPVMLAIIPIVAVAQMF